MFVCKYVGKPGVDEELKDGKQPIYVAVSSIRQNQWDHVTVPAYCLGRAGPVLRARRSDQREYRSRQ